MKSEETKIIIFNYLDYRKYLQDWYVAAQKGRVPVSLRLFSRRAGLTSSNYLKLVMDGTRNLSEESAGKFATALKLKREEIDYFKNLVLFNQAKSHEDKDSYYQFLIQVRHFHHIHQLEMDQYEFYSHWYHSVVRELVTSNGCEDPAVMAAKIFPSLSVEEVCESIELLKRLKLIKKNKAKKWEQTTPLITTGQEPASHVIFNYHRQVLELARDLLPEVPYQLRDMSSMTIGLPRGKIEVLKKKIAAFRKDILKTISTYENLEDVVLLNIQLFPVTKIEGEKL